MRAPRHDSARHVILTAWICPGCDVAGRTPPEDEPECWNCGGEVVVTARPAVPAAGTATAQPGS
ncbi:hypothetical protein GCM10011581_49510 [Saccharopolyspora subtropica]|uniref:Uncharacterized protein n=1 Tax=Saccharopolyspora thermophila TaxID=89367 RepID=A0A917KB83_9PSEU|nr:hypothetical protein [Saccharopolyspora subtropica]GGJ06652.1 hypothetical protein GCM10011581_49510 [Saccharopolyspora subtropica]